MKKLFERITGHRSAARSSADEDGSGFFSTTFLERAEDTQAQVPWSVRRTEVDGQPVDPRRGALRFAELWGQDKHPAALSAAELQRVGDYLSFWEVPAGKQLLDQDEQGDYMLVVLDGVVAVERIQPWGGRARLAEARAGEMLGEMSLLDAGARFSACTTLAPCMLAALDARALERLVKQDPRLALALLASMSRRLSLRLRQVSARLSALLSRE